MASIHSIARSTAVAGAALILVVGATFAHDVATGGLPAADPTSAAGDQDGLKADFDQQASESDGDAAERHAIEDRIEVDDDADQPAEIAEPPKAEKPTKVVTHVKVAKVAKPATADDGDDNDQGENEDNDDNDQGEHDASDHSGSGDGEHDTDGGDSNDGGGD